MSRHSFDPKIAELVGVNSAVIYQSLLFWTEKALVNDKHVHDGKVYAYNSVKAWGELFPYLTANQIRTALEKLVDAGLVFEGNFNETAYDRTKWYGVPAQIHLGKNPNRFGIDHEPIPVSNPLGNPVGKPDTCAADAAPDLFSADSTEKQEQVSPVESPREDAFEAFWSAYPSCKRKTDKPKAREAFWRIVQGKHKGIGRTDPAEIIEGARARHGMGTDPEFYPLPTTWLNGARWQVEDRPSASSAYRDGEIHGMPFGMEVVR